MITQVDKDDLKALAQKATPGEWYQVGEYGIGAEDVGGWAGGIPSPVARAQSKNDAAYVAAASPQAILELIADHERLQKLVELWRHDYDTLTDRVNRLVKDNTRLTIEAQELNSSGGEAAKDYRQLEKETDWLASILADCNSDSDYCLPFCPYHIDKQPAYCDYNEADAEEAGCSGELPCTHRQQDCWREAARNAVKERNNG